MYEFSIFAAFVMSTCLTVFSIINMYNILKFHRKDIVSYAEVKRPSSIVVVLAGLGTILFFIEFLFYIALVFAGKLEIFNSYIPTLNFPGMIYVKSLGLAFTVFGYFLFIWSVVARGQYATSWGMSKNHVLVTWGPYRYVRHPSYTAYFLMFLGFSLTWLNLVAFLPLLAIPGYVKITVVEEELLIRRFGEEYRRYQRRTGKFFPKI